jgi:hypothetical protein
MHFMGGLRVSAQQILGFSCAAITALSGNGCSVLIEADRQQCSTTADCRERGSAFAHSVCSDSVCVADPVWGCVGSVIWPTPPPVPVPEKVTAKLSLSNLLTKAVVSGATARVCGKLDPKCDSPTQTDVRSDDDGVMSIQLDRFFDGYIEIKYPNMVDTMYFFNPPVDADRVIPFLPLVPFDALTAFGDQLKMQPQIDHGTVIGLTYDCQGNSAEGIELSTDGADEFTVPFYMAAGFPSLEATATDKSGQGGIANVPQGPRLISGRRADTGELIGTVAVQTRPIQISYTSMLPTPLSTQK